MVVGRVMFTVVVDMFVSRPGVEVDWDIVRVSGSIFRWLLMYEYLGDDSCSV